MVVSATGNNDRPITATFANGVITLSGISSGETVTITISPAASKT